MMTDEKNANDARETAGLSAHEEQVSEDKWGSAAPEGLFSENVKGKNKASDSGRPVRRGLRQYHELVLLSGEASNIAGRMLSGTMWSIHRLSVLLFFRQNSLSEDEFVSVRDGLYRISHTSRELYAELCSVRKKISDRGLDSLLENVSLSSVFRRRMVVKSPMEKEFLVCLTNFDRLVVLYEFFWVNNLCNAFSCRNRITKLKNRMTDVCAQLLAIRHRLDGNSK